MEHSLTSIDERREKLNKADKPTRDRSTSGQGRSPQPGAGRGGSGVRGGGSSAERLRKGDNDAFEDRIDDMHHNIGKYARQMDLNPSDN